MSKNQKKRMDRVNLSMDLVLKLQFTAVCTLKGLNMSDVVQELVAKWLEENASSELREAIQNESDREAIKPSNKRSLNKGEK